VNVHRRRHATQEGFLELRRIHADLIIPPFQEYFIAAFAASHEANLGLLEVLFARDLLALLERALVLFGLGRGLLLGLLRGLVLNPGARGLGALALDALFVLAA